MTPTNPFRPANRLLARRTGIASFERGRAYGRARYVVRGVDVKTKKDGTKYLSLTLGDRTGDATAISWDGAPLAANLSEGVVVEIDRLEVDEWSAKFDPRDFRIVPEGQYDPREFVPSLPAEQIEHNWAQFQEFLDTIQNPHLQRLRSAVWGNPELAAKFKVHPSAVWHHHNYLGGNVEHVVGIMRVVQAVCASYPELDRDLCIFGAAVHDLGKLREYEVTSTIRVTDEGRLKGHLVMGAEWLGKLLADLRASGSDFPPSLEDHLVHMVLAHHGKGEWGSPKPPATPEALLLHLADMADSQTRGMLQEIERNRDNREGWVKRFDSDLGQSRWIRTRREHE